MKQTKKQYIIYIAFLMLIVGCKIKPIESAEVNFIVGGNGTITMRTVGLGKNKEEATNDAEKKVFNTILFRGLPESEQKVALVGTNESAEMGKHKEYFRIFFDEKRYKTFIMSSISTSNLLRFNNGKKGISIDVKINLVALRKDLEEFNVIRKFGY